jgi:hypothetical protein
MEFAAISPFFLLNLCLVDEVDEGLIKVDEGLIKVDKG